jgi:hypothetical protein
MSVANALAEASALGLGCALRLVAKHQGSAEHDNITLKGHWQSIGLTIIHS